MERFTVTKPAQIISTEKAKLHLKVDYSADDQTIIDCCMLAQNYVQAQTNQWVGLQTVNLSFDTWEELSKIDCGPIISIESVKYLDTEGEEQVVDPAVYRFIRGYRSKILVRPGQAWPRLYAMEQSITVQIKAGWIVGAVPANGEEELPGDLYKCMFLLINHFYEHRELVHTGLQLREFPEHLDAIGICRSHARANL